MAALLVGGVGETAEAARTRKIPLLGQRPVETEFHLMGITNLSPVMQTRSLKKQTLKRAPRLLVVAAGPLHPQALLRRQEERHQNLILQIIFLRPMSSTKSDMSIRRRSVAVAVASSCTIGRSGTSLQCLNVPGANANCVGCTTHQIQSQTIGTLDAQFAQRREAADPSPNAVRSRSGRT